MSGSIRAASSVIAVREGSARPELLVLERSAGSRFLPGYVAFPGGATDAEDADHAVRWFGSRAEARRACAIRELAEEVGLALTAEGIGRGTMQDVEGSPPSAAQLREIAHWIAPRDVPVRFDARYFAVTCPPGVEPEVDGHEAARAWWTAPSHMLEEWGAGRRKLYWPTYVTLRSLAACRSVDEVLVLQVPTRHPDETDLAGLPRSMFWQE